MKTFLLAAMQSGSGKTLISCAILAALKKRGLRLQAFKCGPDYIDPMFHESALGIPSRNLDLFLQGETGVKQSMSRSDAEIGILEGAMGYYDGVNGTEEASAWALARRTGTPAVLVLRPEGSFLTLAALVRGMRDFRPESGIRALLLTDCRESLYTALKPVLERETGLQVLGFLPKMPEAKIESRHLGLLTAAEISDLGMRLSKLAEEAEKHIDLDALLSIAEASTGVETTGKRSRQGMCRSGETSRGRNKTRCRIAVARDEAFCFLYADSLDALREEGAELCFFSPLRAAWLPEEIHGLYLPGGYPERYAEALSENSAMRESIRAAIAAGIPTVAECGGFLYLQESLEDMDGRSWRMCGVLPGCGFQTDRLQRFGYLSLSASEDSLLFRAGEKIPAHEFHYWDSSENGTDLLASKPDGRSWLCGHAGKSIYAGFPHLHLGGELPLAGRFERACEVWRLSGTSKI